MLLQKRNRRGWLEGKDSMIDWLRVPFRQEILEALLQALESRGALASN